MRSHSLIFCIMLAVTLILNASCSRSLKHAYPFAVPKGANSSHSVKKYNKALSEKKPIIVIFTMQGAT